MSSDQQYPHHPGGGYEPQEPYATPDPYGTGAQASPYPQPSRDTGFDGHGQPYPAGADPYAARPGGWAPAGTAAPYPARPADPYATPGHPPAPTAGAHAPQAGPGAHAYAQDGSGAGTYPAGAGDPYVQGGSGAPGSPGGDPYAQGGFGTYAPGSPGGDPYAQDGSGAGTYPAGAGDPYAQGGSSAYAPGAPGDGGPAEARSLPGEPWPADPYAHPASGAPAAGTPAQAGDPYAQHAPGAPAYRDAAGRQQPGAQTWQGETWDTQYQPALAPTSAPAAPHAGALPPETGTAAPAAPAAPAPAATDGYGTPTTSGNSRITDAQRARAEGRSPIIAPGIQPAALTAVLGLLLAGGAAVGPYALLVPLVLLQAVTAAGWFRLNGMWPARQGIVLAFAGGLAADAALLAAGEGHGPAAIIGALGVWVLLTLVLQLRSRASADERLQGLMATVVSAALTIMAAGHLAAAPDAVVVGGLAVAAATVARALPLPGAVSLVVALAAGAGAGIAAGGLTDLGAKGALLGLAAGGCALIGLRVASYDYPSRFVHMTAGVALPLTAAVPALHLVGRALV